MIKTVPFKLVFDRTARWLGFNPRKEIPPDAREAIVDRINDRVRSAWIGWQWPEWQVTEQRAWRQVWNPNKQYSANGYYGVPDEVYHVEDGLYYVVLGPPASDPPVGTVPTNATYWGPLNVTRTYIDYDQPCRRSIGEVSGVFRGNPEGHQWQGNNQHCPYGMLSFFPSEHGIEVHAPGLSTVYIQYKMPMPSYTMIPYAPGRPYSRGDIVFDPPTGECFQALDDTASAPGTLDWTRVPFLKVWEKFVTSGAYADALNEFDQGGNQETQLLEIKAQRAEARAQESFEDEVASLRSQGQEVKWIVRKHFNQWCDSIPWTGGVVIPINEPCEDGIVFTPFPQPIPLLTWPFLYRPDIASLVGPSQPALNTIATAELVLQTMVAIVVDPDGSGLREEHYQLASGDADDTDAGNVEPLDFDPVSNNRFWRRVS